MMSTAILVALIALLPGNAIDRVADRFQPTQQLPALSGAHQLGATQAVPIKVGRTEVPTLTAKGVYAYDRDSGQVLYAKEGSTPRPLASITKMATAITILHRHKPSDIITIPKLPTYKPEDEIIGLKAGDRYTVRDLLAALLINSANDAADALALADSGSNEAFSAQMNSMMGEWGIANARFSNPSGLVDQGNEASPQAIAQISILALHNSTIKQLVAKRSGLITSTGGSTIALTTTNQLLQNSQFSGIKTGYTLAAGQCFVGLASIQGHEIVTVVLGSDDRFGETQSLLTWIKATYQWQ